MFFFSSPLLHVPSPLHLRPLKSNAAEKNLTSDGHKAALHHKTQACSGSTNLPPQSPPSPEVKRPVYELGWRNRLVFTQSESHRNTPAKSTKAHKQTNTLSLSNVPQRNQSFFYFPPTTRTRARRLLPLVCFTLTQPRAGLPPSLSFPLFSLDRPTDRPTVLLTPHVASRRVHCLRFRCGWAGAGGEGAPHASLSRRVPPLLFRENLRASHACPPPCTS